MSLWIKVFTSFYTHRKTLRLKAVLGNDAFWVPPRLWAYAASNQPDGNFSGYSADEIASLIGYSGDASRMLQALLQAQFLDADMRIHDWDEHNGFHKVFAERARKGGLARKEKYRKEEGRREEASTASSTLQAHSEQNGHRMLPKDYEIIIRQCQEERTELRNKYGPTWTDAKDKLERCKELTSKITACRRGITQIPV